MTPETLRTKIETMSQQLNSMVQQAEQLKANINAQAGAIQFARDLLAELEAPPPDIQPTGP